MIALEQDRPALRWSGSFGLVLAVHAAVIGGALWWRAHDFHEPLPQPAEAVMLELAPLPTAPPAPPTELPPGPPQQEQRKAQPKAEPEPVRKPEPRPMPREAEVALPQQTPERHSEDAASADVARTSAPPSVQAPTASQYAANQSLSGADSRAIVNWQSQVLGHLERFKRYPRAAQRRRAQGVALVQYEVDRKGNVLAVRLVRGSGNASLDAEAQEAVQRASPLPAPPEEVPGDPVKVTTPVDFFLKR